MLLLFVFFSLDNDDDDRIKMSEKCVSRRGVAMGGHKSFAVVVINITGRAVAQRTRTDGKRIEVWHVNAKA